jgi:hypothetical protein
MCRHACHLDMQMLYQVAAVSVCCCLYFKQFVQFVVTYFSFITVHGQFVDPQLRNRRWKGVLQLSQYFRIW